MNEIKTCLIYCCGCNKDVTSYLTNGKEIYPHRKDLYNLPFWKCPNCNNYVGCHHKTIKNKTKPLGIIATPELKIARKHIHNLLDPIWKSGYIKRSELYLLISSKIGFDYHTAKLKNRDEAVKVYILLKNIWKIINKNKGQDNIKLLIQQVIYE